MNLTPRRREPAELGSTSLEVADLVACGLTDKAIAAHLELHVQTVKWHVRKIVLKWNLDPTRNYRVQIANRVRRAA